jgi:hypothetical protein
MSSAFKRAPSGASTALAGSSARSGDVMGFIVYLRMNK